MKFGYRDRCITGIDNINDRLVSVLIETMKNDFSGIFGYNEITKKGKFIKDTFDTANVFSIILVCKFRFMIKTVLELFNYVLNMV